MQSDDSPSLMTIVEAVYKNLSFGMIVQKLDF